MKILLTGAIGSGKSTTARKILRIAGFPRVVGLLSLPVLLITVTLWTLMALAIVYRGEQIESYLRQWLSLPASFGP